MNSKVLFPVGGALLWGARWCVRWADRAGVTDVGCRGQTRRVCGRQTCVAGRPGYGTKESSRHLDWRARPEYDLQVVIAGREGETGERGGVRGTLRVQVDTVMQSALR